MTAQAIIAEISNLSDDEVQELYDAVDAEWIERFGDDDEDEEEDEDELL